MNKKAMLLAGAVTIMGIIGTTSLGLASAQSGEGSGNLIDKIASKFNLNKDDVQAVFDEQKAEHQAERQAEFSQRLQDMVDGGNITAEQKTLVEQKHQELRAVMQAEHDELQAWADQNGVTLRYVFGGPRTGDRLDRAVESGDLTQDQKALVEQKREELKNKRDAARDALEQWAKDNGIDQDILGRGLMMGGGKGHGGPGGMM